MRIPRHRRKRAVEQAPHVLTKFVPVMTWTLGWLFKMVVKSDRAEMLTTPILAEHEMHTETHIHLHTARLHTYNQMHQCNHVHTPTCLYMKTNSTNLNGPESFCLRHARGARVQGRAAHQGPHSSSGLFRGGGRRGKGGRGGTSQLGGEGSEFP